MRQDIASDFARAFMRQDIASDFARKKGALMQHYFEAEVIEKKEEVVTTEKKERVGFFTFKIVCVPEKHHYAYLKMSKESLDPLIFKVEISKEEFDALTVSSDASVMLEYKYVFACFHGIVRCHKARIVEVKSSL
jgi:hypothetical protein